MDIHNAATADWLVSGALVFMLAWGACAFFGAIYLIAKYGFAALDRLHNHFTSRKA